MHEELLAIRTYRPTAPVLGEWLSPDDLASALGVTVATLRRWARRRIGPPRVKVGHVILYSRASVVSWLAARESGAQSPSIARR